MSKPVGRITIAMERCKGCGLCVAACPLGIIAINNSVTNSKGYQPASVEDMASCIGCANCAVMCPDCVITVERTAKAVAKRDVIGAIS